MKRWQKFLCFIMGHDFKRWTDEAGRHHKQCGRCGSEHRVIAINRNFQNPSLFLLLAVVALAGCGVPKTSMHFAIGGTAFTWRCPKQFVATNIAATVCTNGTATFTVGSVESKNDPDVIDKAAAGDVARIKAWGEAGGNIAAKSIQAAK